MNKLLETLVQKLNQGVVSFTYVKKDGTERCAKGTLYGIGHAIRNNKRHTLCGYNLAYYDMDCKGWRSFIISNLIEVGNFRKVTGEEHHEICVAMVDKLKETMEMDGPTAFTYRKTDGTIRAAHGITTVNSITDGQYFEYYDTDKRAKRKFRIDSFLGMGEPRSNAHNHRANTTSHSANTTFDKGITIEVSKGYSITLPELGKEQLKELIIKAAERLANL